MELQLPKGMRDFPPEEKILRDKVVGTLTKVFERYGFNPLETPIIERLDVLTAKYGASDETDVMKEVYRFKDQGGRDLGLRYELTVSTARFVGMNPQLKMPFKRYQLGDVFRDGPIKLGRYREFMQCDVDIFGCKGMAADAEILGLILDAFQALSIDGVVQVNNRKLLNDVIAAAGVPDGKAESVIITIDKLEKYGVDEVRKELEGKGIGDEAITRLLGFLQVTGSNEERLARISSFLGKESEGAKELAELFSYVQGLGNVIFTPSLARGLAYYTGTVFEGFFREGTVTSSICGGGRYDRMVGVLLGNQKEVPAVGVAFGIEPITEQLKLTAKERKERFPKTVVTAFVSPIKCFAEALPIVRRLREAGVRTEIDLQGRSISKNLDYANAMEIPFVLIIGKQELAEGKVKVKEMKTGEESLLTVDEAVTRLRQ